MYSSERRRDDSGVWNAYCKQVTPLRGGKVPSPAPAPFGFAFATPLVHHTLDLHGLTVADAHAETRGFLARARGIYNYVTVITGRSGAIRDEFLPWLEGDSTISRIESLNGGGAFRIHFRKPKKQHGN